MIQLIFGHILQQVSENHFNIQIWNPITKIQHVSVFLILDNYYFTFVISIKTYKSYRKFVFYVTGHYLFTMNLYDQVALGNSESVTIILSDDWMIILPTFTIKLQRGDKNRKLKTLLCWNQ